MMFSVYDAASGRIKRFGFTSDPVGNQAGPGEAAVEGEFDGATTYFSGGTPTARPAATAAIAQAGAVVTLSGLAAGDLVLVTGDASAQIAFDDPDGDGLLELTLATGAFTVRVQSFPRLEFIAQVTVA